MKWKSCNKTVHVTNLSRRVGMGKLLCSKSANSRIKPTSYCRIVENMLIVCSKYIRTVANLPMYVTNISRCCGIRMYEAVMPHFKCFFFNDSFWRYIIFFIWCIISHYSCFLSSILLHPFIICHFLFSYDSTQLLNTSPEKRYDVYLLCNN